MTKIIRYVLFPVNLSQSRRLFLCVYLFYRVEDRVFYFRIAVWPWRNHSTPLGLNFLIFSQNCLSRRILSTAKETQSYNNFRNALGSWKFADVEAGLWFTPSPWKFTKTEFEMTCILKLQGAFKKNNKLLDADVITSHFWTVLQANRLLPSFLLRERNASMCVIMLGASSALQASRRAALTSLDRA